MAGDGRRGRPFLRNLTGRTKPRPAGRLFRALGPRVDRCPKAGEPTVVPVMKPRVGYLGN